MSRSILAIVFTVCIGTAFASAADDAKALAEKGDAAAQFRYAEMLREGRGVAKDVRAASEWIRKAAVAGHAAAQYSLAQLYLNPHHPASRESSAGRRAIALFNRAAAQGHTGAKAKLKELSLVATHQQE